MRGPSALILCPLSCPKKYSGGIKGGHAMYENYIEQIKKINDKVDLSVEFPNWNKSVQFKIKDEKDNVSSLYFVVKNGKVEKAAVGELADAEVVIEGNSKAIGQLFDGSLPVTGAFITKEITVHGNVGDAVAAKVLLDAARLF
jgi:putative sterol carrier protein